ncbi:MAG: hypothetical protein ACI4J2_08580 [Ruminococcus sp.]
MDNFSEQLVERNDTTADKLKKILIYGGGTILNIFLIVLSLLMLGSVYSTLGFILAVGIGYGTYYLGQSTSVEYEYAITNGELDVDKIIAKKRRKSLISVDVKTFTEFRKYTEELPETKDMTIVICSDNIASHEYYAEFEHEQYGKTRMIFSPDETMLGNIKKALPARLRHSI